MSARKGELQSKVKQARISFAIVLIGIDCIAWMWGQSKRVTSSQDFFCLKKKKRKKNKDLVAQAERFGLCFSEACGGPRGRKVKQMSVCWVTGTVRASLGESTTCDCCLIPAICAISISSVFLCGSDCFFPSYISIFSLLTARFACWLLLFCAGLRVVSL